ncbi:hypothetical protein [Nonomuraea sp. NPDC049758]
MLPLMDGIGLREPERLARALAGTDVRLVPLSAAPPVYELDTEVLLSHIG